MRRKQKFKLPIFDKKYIEIFDNYKSAVIEQRPVTEESLYNIYVENTDPILFFAKKLLRRKTVVLDNEVRAMFGHLSEYRLSDSTDRGELQKAYGHFRRLNIDMFKIICDEFDKAFLLWLKKYSHYDYRNIKNDFLESLVQKYLSAHKDYLKAQQEERVGSDYDKHQIVSLYYLAAKQYIDAWELLSKYKKQTAKVKNTRILKVSASSAVTVAGIIWSVCEVLHMFNII